MATIISHSELVSQALAFIHEVLLKTPNMPLHTLIDEASARYNLSPKDAQVLYHLFCSTHSAIKELEEE